MKITTIAIAQPDGSVRHEATCRDRPCYISPPGARPPVRICQHYHIDINVAESTLTELCEKDDLPRVRL